MDVSDPAQRRRFYLSRARRSPGASMLHVLAELPTPYRSDDMRFTLLENVPAMLIGAHAAAYAPARYTADVGFLVPHADYADAVAAMSSGGFDELGDLSFAMSNLDLYGSSWIHRSEHESVAVISSPASWVTEAFAMPKTRDGSRRRVIGLPYLVLMKLDASRGVDQGDLSRILGKLADAEVRRVIGVAARHLPDPTIADDIVQYAEIGRWEYGNAGARDAGGRRPGGS